jgi:hypothetical protein
MKKIEISGHSAHPRSDVGHHQDRVRVQRHRLPHVRRGRAQTRKKKGFQHVFFNSQIQFERKFADLENSIMKHFLFLLYLLYFVLRTDHNDFFNFNNSAFVYRNCFLLSFLCYPSF